MYSEVYGLSGVRKHVFGDAFPAAVISLPRHRYMRSLFLPFPWSVSYAAEKAVSRVLDIAEVNKPSIGYIAIRAALQAMLLLVRRDERNVLDDVLDLKWRSRWSAGTAGATGCEHQGN